MNSYLKVPLYDAKVPLHDSKVPLYENESVAVRAPLNCFLDF